MSDPFVTHGKVREMSLGVVVTRADGTVEDHGIVAYYHKNPIKRLVARLRGAGRIRSR